ncbi:MAG: helix-turn-helix domain-containing protein [Puniceicoccales bacterium]
MTSAENIKSHRLAFTRKETAEILGISAPSVDRLTKRGLLFPSRATRRPLYAKPELERFLRETSGCLEATSVGRKKSRPSRSGKASLHSSPASTGSGGVGTELHGPSDALRDGGCQ